MWSLVKEDMPWIKNGHCIRITRLHISANDAYWMNECSTKIQHNKWKLWRIFHVIRGPKWIYLFHCCCIKHLHWLAHLPKLIHTIFQSLEIQDISSMEGHWLHQNVHPRTAFSSLTCMPCSSLVVKLSLVVFQLSCLCFSGLAIYLFDFSTLRPCLILHGNSFFFIPLFKISILLLFVTPCVHYEIFNSKFP